MIVLDVKKMPLGKLSKSQIAKGFEILEEIEEVLKAAKPNMTKINDLSSRFYTAIPHDFGRKVIQFLEIYFLKHDAFFKIWSLLDSTAN